MARTYRSPGPPASAVAAAPPRWLRVSASAGVVLYCAGISAYLLTHGGWPTPDYLIPPLLLAAVAMGRGPAFLADWGPFLLLILGWQVSAGIADQLGRPVHLRGPLAMERALFGGEIPTLRLQDALYDGSRATWYDWAGVIQHAMHFALPVLVGFWLWTGSRRVYWRYLAAVLVLFFFGFLTYVLYPAAPPWMAGMNDLTPPVHRIAVETVLRLPSAAPVGLAYTQISPNTVAAIPSLHAALPLLVTLILARVKGWAALPMLVYTLVMGFYLVYLGEHYLLDVLLGYIYALLAYLLVWVLPEPRWLTAPARAWPTSLRRMPRPVFNAVAVGLTPALAVASVVVILSSLRPGRSVDDGPVVPGLQVQAGDAGLLDPQPCDSGASPSLTAGSLLHPVAGRYAAYLFDVDLPGCYVLTANTQFSPPNPGRVAAYVDREPVRMRPLASLREGVEYFSVYSGYPSEPLQQRGFPVEHRMVLIIAFAEVFDLDAAAGAGEYLSTLAFAPVEPRPAPEVAPPEPSVGIEVLPPPPTVPPIGGGRPVFTLDPAPPVTVLPSPLPQAAEPESNADSGTVGASEPAAEADVAPASDTTSGPEEAPAAEGGVAPAADVAPETSPAPSDE